MTRESSSFSGEIEGTQPFARHGRMGTAGEDPLHAIRTAIAAVCADCSDDGARDRLRALSNDRAMREAVVLLLGDEARAAERPELAAVLFEHLADLHEDLDQPLDAITAMEGVVANAPDRAEHCDRLAWLYRRAGAWAKAAAAFEEVGQLAPDERGRAALRAAGALYREHGQLDRAAQVFRTIVKRRPSDEQAWRELEDVLAATASWRELAEVRGERASRAKSGVERATLLRSQARALEQAGELEAATRTIAEATRHAPHDLSGLIDHADVLGRSGRHAEAAALLRARLGDAVAAQAPADQIAAIRLQLVGVVDEGGDRAAASTLLAELLAEMPDHLPALERAAAFAATDPDPRVHATALLRYASARPDADASLFAAAARQFRNAGDPDAAVRALETAAEIDGAFEDELDDARASLIAERARIAADGGDVAGALRKLRAILATRFALDAHLALVDILCAAGKIDAAADHLTDTLNRLDAPNWVVAPLVHRHAMVQQARGEADEAHRLFHEAHRLDRHSLPITLALGESCFERRLWREAARLLGSLADHPDAPRHASAVALGLVHASLAETRSLRPANAPAHLDVAIRLDPRCAPAWHKLGEDAIERGDLARGAECLERAAAASTAPADRVRLYDALGDMASVVLGDPERAERCWMEIVDVADAPVLGKLLALQRKRGATDDRARTCLRLAELAPDARKSLLEEAAEMLAAAGKLAGAGAIAEQLMTLYPNDLEAVTCASSIAMAIGHSRQAAGWLRGALGAIDTDDRSARAGRRAAGTPAYASEPPGEQVPLGYTGRAADFDSEEAVAIAAIRSARGAALWRRLGDCERQLGDFHAARAAYRKAAAAAPESDSALAARRALVELADDQRSSTAPVALESSLFALVEAEPEAGDALALARRLRGTAPTDARAHYELARTLGGELTADDEAFFNAHPPRPLASDEAYATVLDAKTRAELIDDPDEGPLGELLDLLGEVASRVCSDCRNALVDADLMDAQRIPSSSDAAAVSVLPQINKAFEGPVTLLHTSRRANQDRLLLASPPVIVLGAKSSSRRAMTHADHDARSDAALRFGLGRLVESARWRRAFALGTSRDDFAALVDALRALAPGATSTPDGERLRGKLPITHRQRLADKLASVSPSALDPDAYIAACRRAADRAGLLACGNIVAAVSLAGGPNQAPHLIRLAGSRRYLAVRRALRFKAIPRLARELDDVTSPFSRG